MPSDLIANILFTIGGAAVTFYYIREAIRGLDSKRWPTANGTVIASDMSNVYYDTVTYFPHIKYEYIFESEKFSSSKLAFGTDLGLMSKKRTEQFLLTYKVGTVVKVYYHPKNPKLSVLRPGLSPNLLSLLIGGGIGLLFLISGISKLIG